MFKKFSCVPDSHCASRQPSVPSLTALFSFHIYTFEQLWQRNDLVAEELCWNNDMVIQTALEETVLNRQSISFHLKWL